MSTTLAVAAALVVYLVTKKYATGAIRWVGYGAAVVLALGPAESTIHWLRGFLPAFLGG